MVEKYENDGDDDICDLRDWELLLDRLLIQAGGRKFLLLALPSEDDYWVTEKKSREIYCNSLV